MPGVAGRHNAVEEVHTAGHALNDVAGRTHAHEIAGLIRRHIGLYLLNDVVHHIRGLPYRQAADGVAVAVQLGDLLHVPGPQVRVGGALVDAEQHLPGVDGVRQRVEPVVLRFAPRQPAQRPLTAGLGVVVGCRVLHAFVEGHGDVGTQVGLDAHALLRPHENAAAVQMTGKGDALLADLPQAGQ